MRFFFLIFFLFLLKGTSFSQKKLILKPGISLSAGLNSIADGTKAGPDFSSPSPGLIISLNGRIEYYINPNSFIDLTLKGTEASFSYRIRKKNVFIFTDQTGVEMSQLNFGWNILNKEKSILRKFTNGISIRSRFGFGFGISKNKNNSYYQEYFYRKYYGHFSSTVSFWRMYTVTAVKKYGYHLQVKSGFSIYRKKRELFDVFLEFNKGLQRLSNMELDYNINGVDYHARLASRGTHISLTTGVPISLLHFK